MLAPLRGGGDLLPLSTEPYFLSSPALSPDGKTVVFSFEGDLWKAELVNGSATRLTAMQGYETNARFSPDGQWIAFTGRQFGNADVFVIPMEGGEILQLTWHAANDDVENWSWNSKSIYITSNRLNSGTVYKVLVGGGNPVRLFEHYFNTIHNLAENPKTGELFFNDTWESQSMASRKRYKGDYNPDIQSYNPKTSPISRLPSNARLYQLTVRKWSSKKIISCLPMNRLPIKPLNYRSALFATASFPKNRTSPSPTRSVISIYRRIIRRLQSSPAVSYSSAISKGSILFKCIP